MGQDPSRIRQEIEQTRAQMGETVEALSYKTNVSARTKDAIGRRKDAVVDKIAGARDALVGTASDIGDNVGGALPSGEDVGRTAQQAVSVAQQNPLGLALGAVAVGFLAGMLIPSTRVEDERIGQAADQVKGRIVETGQQALEHGRAVAQDTLQAASQTAKESAQEHGQQLAETAQQQGQQAVEDVRSTATVS